MRNRKPFARPQVGAGPATATIPIAEGPPGAPGPPGPPGATGPAGADGADGGAATIPDPLIVSTVIGGTAPLATLTLKSTTVTGPTTYGSAIIFGVGGTDLQVEALRITRDVSAGHRLLLHTSTYLSYRRDDGTILDILSLHGDGSNRVRLYYPLVIGDSVINAGDMRSQDFFFTRYFGRYGGTVLTIPADGQLVLNNWNENDFDRLIFGGPGPSSALFPALKRNGVGLEVRLADGSALTTLRALLDAGDLVSGSLPAGRLPANIALRDAANVFTQPQTIAAADARLILIDTVQGAHTKRFDLRNTLQKLDIVVQDDAGFTLAVPLSIPRSGAVTIPVGLTGTPLTASDLASGTVPDARFPATLPAISGANLTNLDATDLTGTVADARLSSNVPLKNAANVFTDPKQTIAATSPILMLEDPSRAVNSRKWRMRNLLDQLLLQSIDDSESFPASVLALTRGGGVDLAGLLTLLQGQVKFPATQNPSADANTLDDYEEGSFTCTDASGAGLTFPVAGGFYVKIGRFCQVSVQIVFPATANAAAAKFSGLPFTSGPINGALGAGYHATTPVMNPFPTYWIGASGTVIQPVINGAGVTNSAYSGANIVIVGTYVTAN